MNIVYQNGSPAHAAIEIAGRVRFVPLDTHKFRAVGLVTNRALLYGTELRTLQYEPKTGHENPSPLEEREPFHAYPAFELEYTRQRRVEPNGETGLVFVPTTHLLATPSWVLANGNEYLVPWRVADQEWEDLTGDTRPYDIAQLLSTEHAHILESLLEEASDEAPKIIVNYIQNAMQEKQITESQIADAVSTLLSHWESLILDADEQTEYACSLRIN